MDKVKRIMLVDLQHRGDQKMFNRKRTDYVSLEKRIYKVPFSGKLRHSQNMGLDYSS